MISVSTTRNSTLASILILVLFTVAAYGQEPNTRAAHLQRQRQEKAQQLQPPGRGKVETALFEFKDRRLMERYQAGYKGFHPVFGGLSTGSGFAFGALYKKEKIGEWLDFQASGQVSMKGYQRYQLGLSAPELANKRLFLKFNFTQNNAPQEDFFGIGDDSAEEKRTNFRLETTEYAGVAGVRPFKKLEVGALGGVLNTNVGHGTDKRFPSTEEIFTADTTPALNEQPHYNYAGAFVKYDLRDEPGNPRSGGLYQVGGSYYFDRKLDAYSFRRWKAEIQQYFPFFNERRVIAVRGKLEVTEANADQNVPFFLMPTVGGSEDLRGYTEFRFRDRNTLVLNAEYRWEAFSGLDLALFGDAGNSFHKVGDIKLDELKTSYGIGFRFNTERAVFWRFDLGFSRDGMHFFSKFNHVF